MADKQKEEGDCVLLKKNLSGTADNSPSHVDEEKAVVDGDDKEPKRK